MALMKDLFGSVGQRDHNLAAICSHLSASADPLKHRLDLTGALISYCIWGTTVRVEEMTVPVYTVKYRILHGKEI